MTVQKQHAVPGSTPPLRRRAEAALQAAPVNVSTLSPAEIKRLVRDLQVRQLELEMQNDELRRAQAELAESRDRLADLYDFAPVGYVTLDADAVIREANLAAAHLLAVERRDLLGTSFRHFIATESQDAFCLHQLAALDSPKKHDCELHLRRADGSALPVHLETLRVDRSIRCIIRDVTRQTQADDALRASEDLYRKTLQALPTQIAVINRQGRIIALNQAWTEFAHSDLSDPAGLSVGASYLTYCQRHATAGHTIYAGMLAGITGVLEGRQGHFDMEFLCDLAPTPRWFVITVVPLGGEGGAVISQLDITERKHAEESERTTKEQYRLLFQSNPNPMFAFAEDSLQLLAVNDAMAKQYGWSRDALLTMKATELSPPEEMSKFLDALNQSPASDAPLAGEWLHRRQDGSCFDVELIVSPLHYAGQTARLVLVNDITARKRADLRLRESEQRFRSVVESAMDAIITTDAQQRVVLFNPAAARMFGVAPFEATGAPLELFVPERLRDAGRRQMLQLTGGRADERIPGALGQVYALRPNGTEFPVEASFSSILIAGMRHFTFILRDVTEQRRIQAQLAAKEAELRFITDSVKVMLTRCSRDLRYRFVNRAYATWLNSTPEQLVGRRIDETLGQAAWQAIHPHVTRVLQGHTLSYDAELPLADGDSHHITASYAPEIDATGEVVGWVASINDITERKLEQRRLQIRDAVGQCLTDGVSIQDLAPKVIRIICDLSDWDTGAIWLVRPNAAEIRCVDFWHRPTLNLPKFETLTRHSRPVRGRDSVGRAWSTGKPVIMPDLTAYPSLARAREAYRNGLRSGFSFPIKLGKKVLGVIECHSCRRRDITPDFLNMVSAVSQKLAQFIERTQAEQARRQTEERVRRILESALDGVVTIDATGIITAWNPQAERIFGWSRLEALGRKLTDTIVPPRHRAKVEGGIQHYLDTGQSALLESLVEGTALHRSGREFPIEMGITPLLLDDSLSFSAFVRDITDRKRAEEALKDLNATLEQRVAERTRSLQESEQNLRTIVDTAAEGIIALDRRGRITSMNPAALKMFVYQPEEAVGQNVRTILSLPDPSPVTDLFATLIRATRTHASSLAREITGRRKDGSLITVELNLTAYTHGARRGYVAMVHDVSDRKRLERELLEVGERERKQIGHELHDELGQILHGVHFLASNLQVRLKRQNRPEAAEMNRLARHLDHALATTRSLARGLQPVPPVPEGLTNALREQATRIRKLYGIDCRFVCRKPVTVPDLAVSTHLFRIAQEAMSNAIKHSRCKKIVVRLEATAQRLILGIRDDGHGRFPSPGKRRGMGLHVMQFRAATINGTLVVQRRPGGGTDVVCTVDPRSNLSPTREEPAAETQP